MTSKWVKSIALIFALGALQLSVFAGPALMGKLKTRNNKPVSVNGNQATSGATILSGARIVSPAGVGATVELGPLGRLDMAPASDVTLLFDDSTVKVQLRSGYVILTTKKGIEGVVTTDDGKVFVTDVAKGSSVVATTSSSVGPEVAASVGAQAGGIGATAAGVGVIGAATGAGAAASKRGSDLSSDNPRQP